MVAFGWTGSTGAGCNNEYQINKQSELRSLGIDFVLWLADTILHDNLIFHRRSTKVSMLHQQWLCLNLIRLKPLSLREGLDLAVYQLTCRRIQPVNSYPKMNMQ